MTVTGPTLCTREDVKGALDIAETARADAIIDRIIGDVTGDIERFLHRSFFPTIATRYFDWPNRQHARPWRLWLYRDEVISVTSLVAGGTTIASSDYFLEPANSGPPFKAIEIDLSSQASFDSGDTHQRSIVVTGLWGYGADTAPAGALAAEISTTTATTMDVTDGSALGVGDVALIDSERLTVTERGLLDTGLTLAGSGLTAATDAAGVAATMSGSGLVAGEVIQIDAERMRVETVAGTAATLRRAFDGSVLAAHSSGATVYAYRRLTITRGALGTTAATHTSATAIARHVVPGPVRGLAVAEAVAQLQQERAGYARTAGAGDNERELAGKGLNAKREAVYRSHGRKARKWAV